MTVQELEEQLNAKEDEKKELEKKLDDLQIEKEALEDTITSLQNENKEVKKENQKLLLKVSSNKPTVKNDEELFKGFSKYERR